MAGPPRPYPTVDQTASFSSVHDALSIASSTSSEGLSIVASAALDALKDVLDVADTLPCVKYIAGVGVKILESMEQVQTNEKMVRSVGLRAKDIVLAVARSCEGAQTEMEAPLESDLKQLIETMSEILAFTQELAARSKYKKLLYKSQDAENAKSLDTQLTHAFRIFEIQSSVSLRLSQQQVVSQMSLLSIASTPPVFADRLLHVPEGLYMIRSAWEDRIIESDHRKPPPMSLHAYAAPPSNQLTQYQLWVVYKKDGRELKYTIRNVATGVALDLDQKAQSCNQVLCWGSHGGANQTWEFYGSRQSQIIDYCTIRSLGPRMVLDAKCPSGSGCDYLHQTELSQRLGPTSGQEFCLIRFPFSALPPRPSPSISQNPDGLGDTLPRRCYKLQNVASSQYLTASSLDSKSNEPNILVITDISGATEWHFVSTAENKNWGPEYDGIFAIATGDTSRLATVDHWGGQFITAKYGRFWPTNLFHMWRTIPRDGTFVFMNYSTGRLLYQSKATGLVVPGPAKTLDDPLCNWRLIDAVTGDVCPILYESTLSIMPPELGGLTSNSSRMQAPRAPAQSEPTLRTEIASPALHRQFFDSLKQDHELVRDMLRSGYTSLVVAPQFVRGWKNGRVHDVKSREEEGILGLWKLRGKDGFGLCEPN